MAPRNFWRFSLPLLSLTIPLTALAAICMQDPKPESKPAETPQAESTQAEAKPAAKTGAYPLNLFAQATPDDYIDEKNCAECHANQSASFERSPHATFSRDPHSPHDKTGCQSCHGPGGVHLAHLEDKDEIYKFVINYSKSKPRERAQACLRCHNDTMTMDHWKRTGHAQADVTCTDCHQIHRYAEIVKPGPSAAGNIKLTKAPIYAAAPEPRKMLKADEATMCGKCHPSEVGEFRHTFHHPVPEGRLVCSDCHDLHPRRDLAKRTGVRTRVGGDHSTRGDTAAEKCVTCHGDVAGPFVYEHDPVTGATGEGCLDCHRAHGSHNPKLLNTFSRGVCAQCHTDKSNNHYPGRSCWQAGCHVAIHGSNRDQTLLRR